jgi:hypothetical protein
MARVKVADLQAPGVRGALQHPGEAAFEQRVVLAPERAEAVVVRMGVSTQEAHRHAVGGQALDLAAGKRASGVAVNQQCEHHGGRILRIPAAALVDPSRARVQRGDGLHDEMHQVVLGHPLAQVRRP